MSNEIGAMLTMDEVVKDLLQNKVSRVTVHRWTKEGVELPDGRVIKLGTIRMGKKKQFFTRAMVDKFLNDLQGRPVAV